VRLQTLSVTHRPLRQPGRLRGAPGPGTTAALNDPNPSPVSARTWRRPAADAKSPSAHMRRARSGPQRPPVLHQLSMHTCSGLVGSACSPRCGAAAAGHAWRLRACSAARRLAAGANRAGPTCHRDDLHRCIAPAHPVDECRRVGAAARVGRGRGADGRAQRRVARARQRVGLVLERAHKLRAGAAHQRAPQRHAVRCARARHRRTAAASVVAGTDAL